MTRARARLFIRVVSPYSTAAAIEEYERERTESVRGSTYELAIAARGHQPSELSDSFRLLRRVVT